MRTRLTLAAAAAAALTVVACAPPPSPAAPHLRATWGPGTYTVGVDIPAALLMSEADQEPEHVIIHGAPGQEDQELEADRLLVDLRPPLDGGPSLATVTVVDGTIKPWEARPVHSDYRLDGMWLVGVEWPYGGYTIAPAGEDWAWWTKYGDVNGSEVFDWSSNFGDGYGVDRLELVEGEQTVMVEVYGVWFPCYNGYHWDEALRSCQP